MGSRANLVLMRDGEYDLYYCHWCASSLTESLFWGPEPAIAFIRQQVPATGWLDEVWAEGGAVVDPIHKVLLLFGGEDLRWNIPLRRFYLELLRHTWSTWDVRWAYEGIADQADFPERRY